MNLNKIIKNIDFDGIADERDISQIVHDSRKVKKGSLFIAIAGEKSDWHDYIFDAIDKDFSIVPDFPKFRFVIICFYPFPFY